MGDVIKMVGLAYIDGLVYLLEDKALYIWAA